MLALAHTGAKFYEKKHMPTHMHTHVRTHTHKSPHAIAPRVFKLWMAASCQGMKAAGKEISKRGGRDGEETGEGWGERR